MISTFLSLEMTKYKCKPIDGEVFYTDDSIRASVCSMKGGKVDIGDFKEIKEPAKKVEKVSAKPVKPLEQKEWA